MTEEAIGSEILGGGAATLECPPEELIQPENPIPPISIGDLPQVSREAANRAGWTELTDVQATAIPYVAEGRDMMVQSRTGSGKTGAFVLPILNQLDPGLAECQALVLVPTRELAQQVSNEAEILGEGSGIRSVRVYGGVGYGPQLQGFREGAHLVVGTPGRILDHLIRGSLDLGRVKILVFDEADRMMSMGFYPDMRQIRSYLPHSRSGFMFSATYPTSVRKLAHQFLNEPGFLSLSHDAVHVSETEHFYYEATAMDKDRGLVRIFELENPESAIIFCNTKARVNYLATVLQRFGYDADQLTSDLGQGARDQVLTRLREHQLRFLVATDIAGRGIDISNLSHVINYEIPDDPESYIHRTGRTGRAGASGVALSLVSPVDKADLKSIARRFDVDILERTIPTDEDVQEIVSERLVAFLEARLRTRNSEEQERFVKLVPLAQSLSEDDDKRSLLAMVLDEAYQETQRSPSQISRQAKSARPRVASGGEESEPENISERIVSLLEAKLETRDRIQIERMQRLVPLAQSLSEVEDERLLLAMVLDDYYRDSLNRPPEKKRSRGSENKGGQGPRRPRHGGGGRSRN